MKQQNDQAGANKADQGLARTNKLLINSYDSIKYNYSYISILYESYKSTNRLQYFLKSNNSNSEMDKGDSNNTNCDEKSSSSEVNDLHQKVLKSSDS